MFMICYIMWFRRMLIQIVLMWLFASVVDALSPYEKLHQWAITNGIELSKIKYPVEFPGTGRGAAAASFIGPDEVIFSVPLNLTIRKANAKGTPLEPVVAKMDDYAAAITVFLYELSLGNESFWQPYIDLLPSDLDLLEAWSVEELAEFQDKRVQLSIIEQRNKWKETFLELRRNIARFGKGGFGKSFAEFVQWSNFCWAMRLFVSRSFLLNDKYVALIPLVDLLNSAPGRGGSWFLNDETVYVNVGPKHSYTPGEQVFLEYGHSVATNIDSLYHYGFIVPGSTQSTEDITFPVDIPLKEHRIALNSNREFTTLNWYAQPRMVMQFARLLVASEAEIARNASSVLMATSVKRELAACRAFVAMIAKHLRNKPTTLEQDMQMLNSTTSTRLRLALAYRVDQKQVTLRNLDFCQEVRAQRNCVPLRDLRSFRGYIKHDAWLQRIAQITT